MTDRTVPPGVGRLVTELAGDVRDRLRAVAVHRDGVHLGDHEGRAAATGVPNVNAGR
jgi:hypothetical protein